MVCELNYRSVAISCLGLYKIEDFFTRQLFGILANRQQNEYRHLLLYLEIQNCYFILRYIIVIRIVIRLLQPLPDLHSLPGESQVLSPLPPQGLVPIQGCPPQRCTLVCQSLWFPLMLHSRHTRDQQPQSSFRFSRPSKQALPSLKQETSLHWSVHT